MEKTENPIHKSHRNSRAAMRVVVIGLDGADPLVINKMIAQGRLPTLARFRNQGVFSELETTIPVHSGPAWTAFSTGLKPGKSGIFSFLIKDNGYQYRHAVSQDIKGRTIWQIAGDKGFRVGVANIPFSYPTYPVNGYLISGLPSYEETSYPGDFHKSVYEDMAKKIPEPPFVNLVDPFLKTVVQRDLTRTASVPLLMKNYEVDLSIMVFDLLDRAQHRYWHTMDQGHPAHDPALPDHVKDIVPSCYDTADRMVGHLMEAIGDDAVYIILSDHGFHAVHKKINIPRLLAEREIINVRHVSLTHDSRPIDYHDLDRCLAYICYEDLCTALALNLNIKGREPHGIVPRDKIESLLDSIVQILKQEIDPDTGEPFFEAVYRKEELFSGPMLDTAPDLLFLSHHILTTMPAFLSLTEPLTPPPLGLPLSVEQLTGHHAPHGVFMAYGPGIAPPASWPRTPHITDVPATILSIMGLEPEQDMDGTPLPIYNGEFIKSASPGFTIPAAGPGASTDNALSDHEKQKAIDHLKGMGYL